MKKIINKVLFYLLVVILYFLVVYVFKIRNKVKIIGRRNLPKNKEKILYLANHETFFDSLIIILAILTPWEIFFKQKYIPWNAPDRINFFSSWKKYLFLLLKNIPVDRGSKSYDKIKEQVNSFLEVFEKNESLLLFWQGTETRNGVLGECGDIWTGSSCFE